MQCLITGAGMKEMSMVLTYDPDLVLMQVTSITFL